MPLLNDEGIHDFLEKLVFPFFVQLYSLTQSHDPETKKGKGAKMSSLKKLAYQRRETMQTPILPPFSCGAKKAVALLEKWVKDRVIRFPEVNYLICPIDQNSYNRVGRASGGSNLPRQSCMEETVSKIMPCSFMKKIGSHA